MRPIYASPNGNTAVQRDGMLGRVTALPNAIGRAFAWQSAYASLPVGWRENAITLPIKDGGIAAYIRGTSDMTASAAGSYATGTVTIAGTSSASANGFLTSERTVTITGAGALSASAAGSYANGAVTIKIGTITQDDVTGAVLEYVVEGNISVKEALRILLAFAAGKTTVDGSTVGFRDLADTKDRITAVMNGGVRTTVTLDGE